LKPYLLAVDGDEESAFSLPFQPMQVKHTQSSAGPSASPAQPRKSIIQTKPGCLQASHLNGLSAKVNAFRPQQITKQ
jgi:hypothetical protein